MSAYDDLIAINLGRIEALEEMARRTYEEWFVNYRFPGGNETRPGNWNQLLIKDKIKFHYGKALKASDRNGGIVPVYGSSGIVGYHDKPLVEHATLILGRKGNVGSVHWSKIAFHPIDTCFYLESDLPLEFLFLNMKTQKFLNSDAAVPGLNRNQAYLLPLEVPTDDILKKFVNHAKPLFEAITIFEKQNANLRAQRDLLLPRLISGEIEVSDAPLPSAEAAE